jgi:pSer/pThr/pTyr-binding forkhead associated (FHA) protein
VTDTSSGFALRFISGKYQGGEYPLPAEREIVIGRGGELDIVLVEDMVSRKHAKITTQQGKIVIQDLGSTNGTFVNGEKIKRARLKEGDRILIGTSILKLIAAADAKLDLSKSGATKEELNNALAELSKKQGDKATTMSGTLSEVPLPDLLQLFSTNKKTGVLELSYADDAGKIFFKNGRITYAMLNDNDELGPLKALNRMVAWPDGEFRLGPPSDEEFMLELEEPTDQLVMDAVRMLDEYRRIADSLPEVEDMLQVPKPLSASLGDLSREELEVLQLAFNLGFFQAVLDKSPFLDLKTAEIVKSLMEREYLKT